MRTFLIPGYQLRVGSRLEKATLLKFLQLSYQELFSQQQDFSHLEETVRRYFCQDTPLWWVELANPEGDAAPSHQPVAGLWLGNAIDQVTGDRHAHVFLLYVMPDHRRRGIGSALMCHGENWARERGDRQIGLQVFQSNPSAVRLYDKLGFQTQSLWMVKPFSG
ncbi:MAG: GNAT family N-acetyltransferase [Coleofasciculus sp. G1-WW12-02]|uniref:GNAT family N-acetyltransferase n=1 Tax=unclassified Coleofasciculus TaxID=2692782 RepID=UPI0032F31EAC